MKQYVCHHTARVENEIKKKDSNKRLLLLRQEENIYVSESTFKEILGTESQEWNLQQRK